MMKKNALDFTDIAGSVVDGVLEFLGQKVSLQLISSAHGDPGKFSALYMEAKYLSVSELQHQNSQPINTYKFVLLFTLSVSFYAREFDWRGSLNKRRYVFVTYDLKHVRYIYGCNQ